MKKKLLALALAPIALASTASAQVVGIENITDQIDAAKGHALAIGAAGLTLLGVFVIFKLVRRAANRLV